MARIDDLLDFIQTANEVYLISPARNIRSAFILIDNLCELTMKSWLLADALTRQASCLSELETQGLVTSKNHRKKLEAFFKGLRSVTELVADLGLTSGSSNHSRLNNTLKNHKQLFLKASKKFPQVVDEVKARLAPSVSQDILDMLNRVADRHEIRNGFFHDQQQTALVVTDKELLSAFIDLYDLAGTLFRTEFYQRLQANSVVQSQVVIIKLRHIGYQKSNAIQIYQDILRQKGTLRLQFNNLGYEIYAIYEDATLFYRSLRHGFQSLITQRESRVDKIGTLNKQTPQHREELARLTEEIQSIKEIISECFD